MAMRYQEVANDDLAGVYDRLSDAIEVPDDPGTWP